MTSTSPPHSKQKLQHAMRSSLMWKFRFYGFFKNLRFFEPFLYIMLLALDISLFQIGLLVAIRETFIFLFEIPSGILADKFGKKRELMVCFIFYIISFVFYFLGVNPLQDRFRMLWLVAASIFFGLGESFRSGTHKAMEMLWMDREGITDFKTHIYGSSRQYSLLGSALSAVLAILLVIYIPANQWIFLITIIPYLLDLILIASYPAYMNDHTPRTQGYWSQMKTGFTEIGDIFKSPKLRLAIFSSATYDAIFKTLKDYIQPIILLFVADLLITLGQDVSQEEVLISIILGGLYAIFYLISSFSSKYAYKFKAIFHHSKKAMDVLFDLFAFVLFLEAFFIWLKIPFVVVLMYLLIYIFENFRRPIFVDYMGDIMPKDKRATILSVESQVKAFCVLFFAPLFGLIADLLSIPILFLVLSILMVLWNLVYLRKDSSNSI
jgi:MFS family permease